MESAWQTFFFKKNFIQKGRGGGGEWGVLPSPSFEGFGEKIDPTIDSQMVS